MIAALYKTWRGEEFVEQSLNSIYGAVDKIVMLHSEVSWSGQTGNTVKPVVKEWKQTHNPQGKLIEIDFDSRNQEEQYAFGMKWIKGNLPDVEWVLIVDTDEVWDEDQLELLFKIAHENPGWDYFKCAMFTYIKSPFYRITPAEPCRPLVLAKSNGSFPAGPRGNSARAMVLDSVRFHHFTLVRHHLKDIKDKIGNSAVGDHVSSVNFEEWIEKFWKDIPNIKNFHYSLGFETAWEALEVVEPEQLPAAMRGGNWIDYSLGKGHTWQKEKEFQDFISWLARNARIKNVIEIGIYRGGSTYAFAQLAAGRNGRVIAVDHALSVPVNNPKVYEDNWSEDYITTIEGNSQHPDTVEKVKHELAGEKADLLFIDGSHEYQSVKQDFENYRTLVAPGGFIAFHDILRQYMFTAKQFPEGEFPATEIDKFITKTPRKCIDVFRLWEEIKNKYDSRTFLQIEGPGQCFWGGIGLIRWQP